MIVIDTSVLIDFLFERDAKRNIIAKKIVKILKGLKIFVPRIFLIEFIAVARRLGMKISRLEVIELTSDFIILSEDVLFEEAFNIAETIHPRASDAYFIATAKLTNSILITNDKIMNENAKKYGVESYYLIDEYEKVEKRIKEMK